jgi:hypothetical protein
MRELLSALWSFLHHPAATFEEHLTALEQRLKSLEARLAGDLATGVDTGVVAAEEAVASAEHRLEDDFKGALRSRVAGIQVRLEAVKTRVVEDLKRELRRVALLLTLMLGCGVLALVAMIFGLMAAWGELRDLLGSVGASLLLAMVFLLGSIIVFVVFRSVLHRVQSRPAAGHTAT